MKIKLNIFAVAVRARLRAAKARTAFTPALRKGSLIMQTRHPVIAVLFGLIGVFLYAAPPVHSTTLGLADNTTYNIFIDLNDDGTDFVGTLTTGAGVVTDFQLQILSTVFDFTAPSDSSDDTVSQNNANVFSITDDTPPGFTLSGSLSGSLTLNADGTWSGLLLGGEELSAFLLLCPNGFAGITTCTWSATAIPEPSSLLLIAVGVIALGVRGKARHRGV